MTRAPLPGAPEGVDVRGAIDALANAIAAARVLGLDVEPAEAVRREAEERLLIAPDAYVVALVGGTGVGKSTLLNAIAGETVSEAGARRPTTGRPVAWVAASAVDEVRPLLERLEVGEVRSHAGGGLERVVVLDLPDVDSLDRDHQATVEAVLPKVDVVAWVTDPEKYADAVLHDQFLRAWMGRLDRQIVILNKTDRLQPDAVERVRADLGRVLAGELLLAGRHGPEVVTVAAIQGETGIAGLRSWLDAAVDAKLVVGRRLVASAAAVVVGLARDVVGPPLLSAGDRTTALNEAVTEVLRVVDLQGAERQAIAATRARARRRGTGPIGVLTSAIWRISGRARTSADPGGYLRAWRARGGLTRAAESVRRVAARSIHAVPSPIRAPYAEAIAAGQLEGRLETAVDHGVGRQPEFIAPTSRLWPVIGALQSLNTLVLVFAAAWLVVLALAHPAVGSVDLPVLGPTPTPLVVLGVGLVSGYVLARILGIHAGWLGRRWGRRLTREISTAVRNAVADEAFGPIDRIEDARAAIDAATRALVGPLSG